MMYFFVRIRLIRQLRSFLYSSHETVTFLRNPGWMWYNFDIGLAALNRTVVILEQKSKNNPKMQHILDTYTKNVGFF